MGVLSVKNSFAEPRLHEYICFHIINSLSGICDEPLSCNGLAFTSPIDTQPYFIFIVTVVRKKIRCATLKCIK